MGMHVMETSGGSIHRVLYTAFASQTSLQLANAVLPRVPQFPVQGCHLQHALQAVDSC